ncbi:T9SS type A sorting domain-containing protein [Tellurirhabdus bombi]|uniref:T9SS type A sorting domain-containing protein n=1 Tax=Tellurirhabdus bombi TaxID=2907205 RepID=UPI001F1886D9|nr:T9SS type A sorting domain-containing protein [Tellurirhabdus bombi]
MKTLLASFVIALTLGTSTSFAKNEPIVTNNSFQSVVYPSAESTKLNVIVDSKSNNSLLVRLLTTDGNELATQRIVKSKRATHVRFDLINLQDGVYKVEITDGEKKEIKEITLSTTVPTPSTYRTIALQ